MYNDWSNKNEDQKNAGFQSHAIEATTQSAATDDEDQHGRSEAPNGWHEEAEVYPYA